MKPKFTCTHCGRDEIDARENGCGEPAPRWFEYPEKQSDGSVKVVRSRINGCPMEIKSPFRRFLFNRFGIMP